MIQYNSADEFEKWYKAFSKDLKKRFDHDKPFGFRSNGTKGWMTYEDYCEALFERYKGAIASGVTIPQWYDWLTYLND